jgi:hypothetical protein
MPLSSDLADHMRAGSFAVSCLADVPDGPILGRNAAVLYPRSARRRRTSFTGIISNVWRGWTSWWPITAFSGRCAPPISKPRTKRARRRSSAMSKGLTSSTADWSDCVVDYTR